MAIITYPLNGIEYNAEDAQVYLSGRTSGVYYVDNNFTATVTGDSRDVTIGKGRAWISNTEFSGKSVCLTEPEQVIIPLANGDLPRIDLIALRFDKAQNQSFLVVMQGTPAASPVPPSVTRTELIYELGLYTVSVPAGSTYVLQSHITNVMADEKYCGFTEDLAVLNHEYNIKDLANALQYPRVYVEGKDLAGLRQVFSEHVLANNNIGGFRFICDNSWIDLWNGTTTGTLPSSFSSAAYYWFATLIVNNGTYYTYLVSSYNSDSQYILMRAGGTYRPLAKLMTPPNGIVPTTGGGTGNTQGYVEKLGISPYVAESTPFTVKSLQNKLVSFAKEQMREGGGYTLKSNVAAFNHLLATSWPTTWNSGDTSTNIQGGAIYTFVLTTMASNAGEPLCTYLVTSYNNPTGLMYLTITENTFSDVYIVPKFNAIASAQLQDLRFQNVSVATSAWASNTSQTGYSFRAAVACSGVTAAMLPEVIFSAADAAGGNFAPVCEAYAGGVYIYAKIRPSATMTIPTIVARRY